MNHPEAEVLSGRNHGGRPLIEVDGLGYRRKSLASHVFKRGFDLLFAGLGLIMGLPLFVVIAVLIKLDSKGPIFFRQTRVGRYRKLFKMWKFRKMHDDLPVQGPSLTLRYDFRMTRFGRILERTKLDELPQLINVLQGHMSVIGPRPEVTKFVEHYPDRWNDVLSVKPGIFGPNQLRNRNESELYPPGVTDVEGFYLRHILPDKLEVDAKYARGAGPVDDVLLMVRCLLSATFGTVTWKTVTTMRQQIANLLVLSAAGVGGMMAAHALEGFNPTSQVAMHAILLALIVKPMSLLILKVPKSLAVSLTAEDLLRLVRCAIGGGAAILIGMYAMGHREIAPQVFVLDTALFLGAMLIYKLVLYTAHLTYKIHPARILLRRLILASAVVAPVAMAATLAWLGGPTARIARADLVILLVALIVRPTAMLLMAVPGPRANPSAEMWSLQLHLAATSFVGSGLMLLGSALAGHPMGTAEILLDTALFHVMMVIFTFAQGPLTRAAHQAAQASGPRERIVLAGSGIELGAYVSALAAIPESECEIVGIVTPNDSNRTSMVGAHSVLGQLADLPQILTTLRVDQLVVVGNGITRADLNLMRKTAAAQGCQYLSVPLLAGLLSKGSNGRHDTGARGPNQGHDGPADGASHTN